MLKRLFVLLTLLSLTYTCDALTRPSILQINTISTMEDLKATSPSVDGTWAHLRGYFTDGDGGGGGSA